MITKTSQIYKKHILALTIGPVLKMIEAIFDLLIPLFMKAIIDLNNGSSSNVVSETIGNFIKLFGKWVDNDSLNYALIGGTCILVMGIIGFLTTMCTQYVAAKTSTQVGKELRDALYEKTLSLNKMEREQIGNNKLLTILNADSYQVQQGVLIFIRLIVRAPFIILGALVISFILNWQIGIIFTCIIPLILLVVFGIMSKSSKEYLNIQAKLDKISTKTSDTIEGAKVIRAFERKDYEESSFETLTNDYQTNAIKVSRLNALINPLTFAIIALATIAVILFGGLPMFESSDAVSLSSTIITEVAYLSQIFTTLVQLTNVVMILTKARVSTIRVDSVLSFKPSIINKDGAITKEIKSGEEILSFHHVDLGYIKDGNLALKNIDFSLLKGQSLGIIGGTGSGKSTLINLMERFVDPTNGYISYKGQDIKDYDLISLRNELSLVPQKSVLFKGTILSNMLMAKPDASEEEIASALKDAMAYEFVSKNEEYLSYPVEEGGKNFSGGQRQRLCIARALLKNPEIIILDDSTSALDLLTDRKVRDNIHSHYQGITKIIVSQRVSTVSDCDLILVLEGGSLLSKGTHEELLSSCKVYRETYESQTKKGGE